jgi:sialate O-acetylesterase
MKKSLLLLLFALSAVALQAAVKPANIFTANMVLQRNEPVKVWGTADANQKVTVSFDKQKVSARADRAGRWSVTLKAMPAGGPFDMTINAPGELVVIKNVLVGEVWLCSGQSNMEWRMRDVRDAKTELAGANHPQIRCFTVQKAIAATPAGDLDGRWDVCSPETVGDFTAVGYFFARKLQQELGVPVGIINSSWGGTDIEVWTSTESYNALTGTVAAREYNPAVVEQIAADPSKVNPNHWPSTLYNAMIAPITDFRIKGAIWYQGEANAWNALSYRTLFPNMIRDWRTQWGYEFPFYWVQLANFMAEDNSPVDSEWAELREAQTMTLALPRTGQAVTIDIGEAHDIHPRNKQDVGLRLALNALNKDYGRTDLGFSGPVFKSVEFDGRRAMVTMETFGSKLSVADKYGYLRGFTVAGEDRVFHWATARIGRDGRVTLFSREVDRPVAVRYAWANNPMSNLCNAEGLPAVPFRTDQWPEISK